MLSICKLNNKLMRNIRREQVYQAIAIDLTLLGILTKAECEMLIGGSIPNGLLLPDGSQGKEMLDEDTISEDSDSEADTDDEGTTESDN